MTVSPLAAAQEEPDDDAPDPNQVQQGQFEMPEEQFDQWLFQGRGDASAGRTKLDAQLKLQIEEIDRTCAISAAQKQKLQLAGRGDIKRFFDRVEEVRVKFREVRKDQNKIGEIFQQLQPLQVAFHSGLFGENSFTHKVLKNTLSSEQYAKYEQVEQERLRFRYRARVALAVAMLENSLPLDDGQRQQLLKLIEEKTKPPKKRSQYDYYIVLVQLSKLPEATLKPIFDDKQWKLLTRQLTQMRGMEQFLKNSDLLP